MEGFPSATPAVAPYFQRRTPRSRSSEIWLSEPFVSFVTFVVSYSG